MDDPFVQEHDAAELEIAGEFLTNWLPFLTRGLCDACCRTLADRVRSLRPDPPPAGSPRCGGDRGEASGCVSDPDRSPSPNKTPDLSPIAEGETTGEFPSFSEHVEASGWGTDPEPGSETNPDSPKVRMSWADMAAQEEDELAAEEERSGEVKGGERKKVELTREQREWIRFKNVGRKKDFICLERVNGKLVNVLSGLELHTGVFSAAEQKRIVDFVYELQEKGRRSELGERTYTAPRRWMPGKGRVTIQFGCCYNYAMDRDGNPPGILQNVAADPIPNLFKVIIRRLVRWHVLPTSCIPNSCIVNIYEPGDCIPPHIDSHDFVRPFCTVSFLSECNILFGTTLNIVGDGKFEGSTAISLPVGSVLILNGNGADVAKHCVPAVPTKRISITFRKMDEAKEPAGFTPEPDLQNIQLLPEDNFRASKHQVNSSNKQPGTESRSFKRGRKYRGGRTAAVPYQSHDHETPLVVRSRQVIDARSASSSHGSMGRSQDVRRLRDDGDEPIRRYPHQELADEGSRHGEVAMQSNGSGRRVRMDQKRIIVSRNMDGDEEAGSHSSDRGQHPRGPYHTPTTGRRRIRLVVSDD